MTAKKKKPPDICVNLTVDKTALDHTKFAVVPDDPVTVATVDVLMALRSLAPTEMKRVLVSAGLILGAFDVRSMESAPAKFTCETRGT